MVIVTGGAGFIGSAVVWELNRRGEKDIIIVDELGKDEKWKNLVGLKFDDFVNKNNFLELLNDGKYSKTDAIIHLFAVLIFRVAGFKQLHLPGISYLFKSLMSHTSHIGFVIFIWSVNIKIFYTHYIFKSIII